MTIIERIDELRAERGWSVNYLAMEAMLTQSTLSNIYLRNTEPKLSTLRAVCGAFGISLSEFFSFEENNEADDMAEIKRRVCALTPEQRNALLVLLRGMG